MAPELETLDQLQSGDLSLDVVRNLFPDAERFRHAIIAMLDAGELRVLDSDDRIVPSWKHAEILGQREGQTQLRVHRISITDLGAARIR